jgi:capsular exopolysaccharide synthesis family protein
LEPIHYLRALRRHWWVIAAAVVVATAAGWIVTSFTSTWIGARSPTGFSATTVLWNPSDPALATGGPLSNPATIAQMATQPQVAAIAARQLDADDPLELTGEVTAYSDETTGFIYVKGTSPDPERSEAVATAFSDALITYLGKLRTLQFDQQENLLQQQIDRAQALHLGPTVKEQLSQQQAQIALNRTIPVPISTFSKATAIPDGAAGSGPAWSRLTLVLLAALVGLLLGIALALVLERSDTRIRTRQAAEDGFGLPVLAEVPSISRRRRHDVVTASDPLSRAADAFRLLSVGVAHSAAAAPHANDEDGAGNAGEQTKENGSSSRRPTPPKTILITSAEPRDGKTTVAANLAAAYAEVGKRVLVVSCDLRRPAIHKMFHVADRPGLTELLGTLNGELDTSAKIDLGPYVAILPNRLAVMPSGAPSQRPGEVLGSATMHKLVGKTKDIVDVVVLDSAPLLVASDAAALAPEVDAVVLVARAGKTRTELGGRSTNLLEQLGATVVGVVLNDSTDPSIHRSKRRYRLSRGMRKAAQTPANGSADG